MKYKAKIASMFCDNQDIITALNIPKEKLEKDDFELLYNYIHPYIYIPKIQEEVENHICFALDIPRISENEYFKYANLTVYAICHKDDIKTKYGGTRTDVLEGIIVDMFNWNLNVGFELSLVASNEKVLTDDYYVRIMTFDTLKFNSLSCGVKNGTPK